MNRPQEEFFRASLAKVLYLIGIWSDEQNMKACAVKGENYNSKYFNIKDNVETVRSLHDIEGMC